MTDRGGYSALAPPGRKPENAAFTPNQRPSPLRRAAARPARTALIVGAVIASLLVLILGLVFGLRARDASSSNSSSSSSSTVTSHGTANLDLSPPKSAFPSIQEAFVSFAIEFYYLPDFAGTPSSPGTFSDNLLNNIGNISGTKPYVRVGGNSQDLAIYESAQQNATQATFTQNVQGYKDFVSVKIGPSFFDSFKTWEDVKFIYGLNLKNASTSAVGWQSLLDTIPVACKALNDSLLYWEYGNEPDYYHMPKVEWNDDAYVSDWSNGTNAIKDQLSSNCPEMASDNSFGFVGPSLAEPNNLPPMGIFQNGYNKNGSVKIYALHNYMGDCSIQTCNMQANMMNHTAIVQNLNGVANQITPLNNGPLINPTDSATVIPFVLDETNSFLSLIDGPAKFANVFGAALWTVDYMLWAASIGISRMHMQQGTDFGYNSWQPLTTGNANVSVSPPYYGNIAVATMIGNIPRDSPRVVPVSIPNADDMDSAYATYVNGSTLARIAVINLHQHNATGGTAGSARNGRSYTFGFPSGSNVQDGHVVTVQRMMAAGSDVNTSITFDGWSYDYDLADGKPVKVGPTTAETLTVGNGLVTVAVNDSSAAILNFVNP